MLPNVVLGSSLEEELNNELNSELYPFEIAPISSNNPSTLFDIKNAVIDSTTNTSTSAHLDNRHSAFITKEGELNALNVMDLAKQLEHIEKAKELLPENPFEETEETVISSTETLLPKDSSSSSSSSDLRPMLPPIRTNLLPPLSSELLPTPTDSTMTTPKEFASTPEPIPMVSSSSPPPTQPKPMDTPIVVQAPLSFVVHVHAKMRSNANTNTNTSSSDEAPLPENVTVSDFNDPAFISKVTPIVQSLPLLKSGYVVAKKQSKTATNTAMYPSSTVNSATWLNSPYEYGSALDGTMSSTSLSSSTSSRPKISSFLKKLRKKASSRMNGKSNQTTSGVSSYSTSNSSSTMSTMNTTSTNASSLTYHPSSNLSTSSLSSLLSGTGTELEEWNLYYAEVRDHYFILYALHDIDTQPPPIPSANPTSTRRSMQQSGGWFQSTPRPLFAQTGTSSDRWAWKGSWVEKGMTKLMGSIAANPQTYSKTLTKHSTPSTTSLAGSISQQQQQPPTLMNKIRQSMDSIREEVKRVSISQHPLPPQTSPSRLSSQISRKSMDTIRSASGVGKLSDRIEGFLKTMAYYIDLSSSVYNIVSPSANPPQYAENITTLFENALEEDICFVVSSKNIVSDNHLIIDPVNWDENDPITTSTKRKHDSIRLWMSGFESVGCHQAQKRLFERQWSDMLNMTLSDAEPEDKSPETNITPNRAHSNAITIPKRTSVMELSNVFHEQLQLQSPTSFGNDQNSEDIKTPTQELPVVPPNSPVNALFDQSMNGLPAWEQVGAIGSRNYIRQFVKKWRPMEEGGELIRDDSKMDIHQDMSTMMDTSAGVLTASTSSQTNDSGMTVQRRRSVKKLRNQSSSEELMHDSQSPMPEKRAVDKWWKEDPARKMEREKAEEMKREKKRLEKMEKDRLKEERKEKERERERERQRERAEKAERKAAQEQQISGNWTQTRAISETIDLHKDHIPPNRLYNFSFFSSSKKEKTKSTPPSSLAISGPTLVSSSQNSMAALEALYSTVAAQQTANTAQSIKLSRASSVISSRASTVHRRRVVGRPASTTATLSDRVSVATGSYITSGARISMVGSVGGHSLIDLSQLPDVPLFLQKLVEVVEQLGMDAEGLYRVSGNSKTVTKLRKLVEADPTITLLPPRPLSQSIADAEDILSNGTPSSFNASSSLRRSGSLRNRPRSLSESSLSSPLAGPGLYDEDVHVVTGAIKSWLRDGLPPKMEPLCTFELYEGFINATKIEDYRNRMIAIQDLIHNLPTENFAVLKFICEHLCRVSQFSHLNRMTISNLAIIFGPTLLRPSPRLDSVLKMMADMPHQVGVVEILIEHADWLFGPIEYEDVILFEDGSCYEDEEGDFDVEDEERYSRESLDQYRYSSEHYHDQHYDHRDDHVQDSDAASLPPLPPAPARIQDSKLNLIFQGEFGNLDEVDACSSPESHSVMHDSEDGNDSIRHSSDLESDPVRLSYYYAPGRNIPNRFSLSLETKRDSALTNKIAEGVVVDMAAPVTVTSELPRPKRRLRSRASSSQLDATTKEEDEEDECDGDEEEEEEEDDECEGDDGMENDEEDEDPFRD